MAEKYIFHMHGVSKFYGQRQVLKDINLSFYPGAKIGIVGENGSGKTTVLRIMAGLETEFDGHAEITPGFRSGMVAQEPELAESLTVRETIESAFAKIKELLDEKDELGSSYIYGSYYDSFRPAGEGYTSTFIKRISSPGELVAERYTLTLEKQGTGWQITDEKLEQRVEGLLYRSIPGDENFYKFESVSFDREGLKLSGGAGDLMVDITLG